MYGDGESEGGPAGEQSPVPSPVQQQVAAAEACLDGLTGLDWTTVTNRESLGLLARLHVLAQRCDAAYIGGVGNLEARPGLVAGAQPGRETTTFIRTRLLRSPARAALDVRLAHLVDPLPGTMGLYAAGGISTEHVDGVARAVRTLPARLLTPELWAAVDGWAVATLPKHAPDRTGNLVRYLIGVLDPDGSDPFQHDRRGLSLARDFAGMLVISGQADAASAAPIEAAFAAASRPRPDRVEIGEDGIEVTIHDLRTLTQRRVDALVEISRVYLAHLDALEAAGTADAAEAAEEFVAAADDTPAEDSPADDRQADHRPAEAAPATPDPGPAQLAGPRAGLDPRLPALARLPLFLIDTDIAQLGLALAGQPETGLADTDRLGPITGPQLARFLCDAILQAVTKDQRSGGILTLGRTVRTISPAQRTALYLRDKGCVIPGCRAPARWCEAHHIQYWRNNGRTDIQNLALVCWEHHTAVHAGHWLLQMREGRAWARPPVWLDRQQHWIRNTYWDDIKTTQQFGRQLRLKLDHPAKPPDPPGAPAHTPDTPDEPAA